MGGHGVEVVLVGGGGHDVSRRADHVNDHDGEAWKSVMVRTPASICVGCHWSVRPFHRHPGVRGEFVHHILCEATELDPVVEAAEHGGGIGHAFLATKMRSLGRGSAWTAKPPE
jgi:hypothetical protein